MEYKIERLRPGSKYIVQIRSISDDQVSEWSPSFFITIPSDDTVPANVTGISGSYINGSFKFVWSATTTNTNATTATDIKGYDIQVTDGTNTYDAFTSNKYIIIDRELFLAEFSGDTLTCKVKAQDSTGNKSPSWATASVTAPAPSTVGGASASGTTGGINLKWTAVTNTQILEYEIYEGSSSGFTPDTSTFTNLAGTTSSNQFTWSSGTATPTTRYFKIRAKSIYGTYSAAFTSVSGTTVAAATDTSITSSDIQTFSYTGTLMTYVGTGRYYVERSCTISKIRASVGGAPSGSSVIIDVNKNGTTVFTTQANRPTIAAGQFTSGAVTSMNITSLSAGDYLTIDIDQIGSGTAGSDLVVSVVLV